MKRSEARRVVPLAHIAAVGVGILLVFELAVAGGAVRIPAGVVARYAPWAYEPFLKLVGEHPDALPAWVIRAEQSTRPGAKASGIEAVTELGGIPLPLLQGTNTESVLPESVIEFEAEPEPADVIGPTNTPGEIIPVG